MVVRARFAFAAAISSWLGIYATWASATWEDVQVSAVGASVVDPEFDPLGNRLAWTDAQGQLWLAWIDSSTGDLIPPDAKGRLLDINVVANNKILNGVEWAFGTDTSYIVYNKELDGELRLYSARYNGRASFTISAIAGGQNRYRPVGTWPGYPGPARIIALGDEGQATFRYYRDIDGPLGEQRIEDPTLRHSQFVPGTQLIVGTTAEGGDRELSVYAMGSGRMPFDLTNDGGQKSLPALWLDPESGEPRALANVDTREIVFYRQGADRWEPYYRARPPTSLPYLQFPRLFTYGGKSYVAVIAAEELSNGPGGNWLGVPAGACEVWLMGIDPAAPFFRQLNDPARIATRVDLEVLEISSGPKVYYTEIDELTQTFTLWRAGTGLEPPVEE